MAWEVLIVDDEHPIRYGLAHGVDWERFGFSAAGAVGSAEDALDLLTRRPIDLLVTDIRMPGMDGVELIRRVRQASLSTEIVVLSGFGDFEYTQKAIEYGVFAYLLKPVKDEELQAVLEKLRDRLSGRRAADQDREHSAVLWEFYMTKLLTEGPSMAGRHLRRLRELGAFAKPCLLAAALRFELPDPGLLGRLLCESGLYWRGRGVAAGMADGRMYLVFGGERPGELYPRICRELADYGEAMGRLLPDAGFRFRAGVSEAGEAGGLTDRLEEAGAALRAGFYLSSPSPVRYGEARELLSRRPDWAACVPAGGRVTDCVAGGQPHSLKLVLHELSSLILSQGCFDEADLILRLMELYLSAAARLSRLSPPVPAPPEQELHQQLLGCGSLDSMLRCLEEALGSLARAAAQARSGNENALCANVRRYIEENFDKKLTLREIADVFFLSPAYLSAYFKEKTGVNLFDHLQEVRLSKAKELLKSSSLPVTEVSVRAGFSDYRYFCTAFKKDTGLTPLKYRLKNFL